MKYWAFVLFLLTNGLDAQTVYKCTDSNGTTVFSQQPCGANAQSISINMSHSDIEVTHDKFSDTTKYTTRSGEPEIGKFGVQDIIQVSKTIFAGQIHLMWPSSTGWKYLECHGTTWLLDGAHISLPEIVRNGVAKQGFTVEGLSQSLTRAQFEQFARAKSIEYKVCNDEHSFTAEQISELRAIVRRVDRDFPLENVEDKE